MADTATLSEQDGGPITDHRGDTIIRELPIERLPNVSYDLSDFLPANGGRIEASLGHANGPTDVSAGIAVIDAVRGLLSLTLPSAEDSDSALAASSLVDEAELRIVGITATSFVDTLMERKVVRT